VAVEDEVEDDSDVGAAVFVIAARVLDCLPVDRFALALALALVLVIVPLAGWDEKDRGGSERSEPIVAVVETLLSEESVVDVVEVGTDESSIKLAMA